MKFVRTIALAILVSSLPVAAQATTELDFHAICFDPQETKPPTFFISSRGKKRKEIEIDKTRLSGPFNAKLRDDRQLDFFTAADSELPFATVTFRGLPTVPILIVFTPIKSGYRAIPIELPPGSFKGGTNLLVNASNSVIGVRSGNSSTVTISPTKNAIVAPPEGFKNSMIPVQIFEKRSNGDEWQIVQSTRWPVDSRFRSYIFIYRDPRTERLKLHGIPERIDTPAKE